MSTVRTYKKGRGRHPKLKIGSVKYDVYMHFVLKGSKTAAEIRDDLGLTHAVAMARCAELRNSGLLVRTGEMRDGGYILKAVRENETGFDRDEIVVEHTVYTNEFGQYSIESRIVNEEPTARTCNRTPVWRFRKTYHVPGEYEPPSTRGLVDAPPIKVLNNQPLTDHEDLDVIEA